MWKGVGLNDWTHHHGFHRVGIVRVDECVLCID